MKAFQKKVMILTLVFLLSCVGVLGLSIIDTYPNSNTFVPDPTDVNVTTNASAVNVTYEWINSTGGVEASDIIFNDSADDKFFNATFSTSGLVEGRTYDINFTATNSSGATATSQVTNVTPDSTAPNTSIVSPADGANVTDTTPDITFNITDNLAGTITYNLSVNGTDYIDTMSSGTEKTATITSALAVGSYTVSVTGTDEAGNVGATDSITLNIVSAPTTTTSSGGGGGKTSTWAASTRTETTTEGAAQGEDIRVKLLEEKSISRTLETADSVRVDGWGTVRVVFIDPYSNRVTLDINDRQGRYSEGDTFEADLGFAVPVRITIKSIDTSSVDIFFDLLEPRPEPTQVEVSEPEPQEVQTEAPETEEPKEEPRSLVGAAVSVLDVFDGETPLPVKIIMFLIPVAIGLTIYSGYTGKKE